MKIIKNLKAEEIRKSILQLAIQGKLVKQNPNDEPASELVKRIYAEKQKLIKDGKIKRDKNESYIFKGDDNCYYEKIGNNAPVKLEDLPFDIPDNWTWIRFPNLVNFILGKTPERHNPKYWNDGKYPWFSISDMKDKQTIFETKEKISDVSLKENFNSFLRPAGTLIMSFKLTVGRVSILGVDGIHNEAIVSIFPYLTENNTIRDWLFYILGLIVEYVDHTDAIKGSTLNKQKMNTMLIPLPPLREQNRIIAKILETKPLIDRYNEIETKLSQLEQEFPEKLKKSVLQYAIEGKLVKQDPNDEPASILLERIKAEKEKLIKEGKIKRDKNESYIYQGDDKNYYEKKDKKIAMIDVPFSIPSLWIFERLSNACKIVNGFTPLRSNPAFWDGDINWMTVDDINKQGKYISSTIQHITINAMKSNERVIPSGSTFICCTSATIGKTCINNVPMCSNQQFNGIVIKDTRQLNNEYLYYFCSTLKKKLLELAGITTFPFVSVDKLSKILIPIPPANQQKLIVNKIKLIENLIQSN